MLFELGKFIVGDIDEWTDGVGHPADLRRVSRLRRRAPSRDRAAGIAGQARRGDAAVINGL
jgi:hypothetical protein